MPRLILRGAVPFGLTLGLLVTGVPAPAQNPEPAPPQSPDPEVALADALEWLAQAQEENGSWSSQRHGGHPLYDVGQTGLALLALLGGGHTHNLGAHSRAVTDGLLYLKNVQDSEGCFGSRVAHNFTYSHIIATHAFVEAYRRTRFPLFKRTAQKALDFLEHARNPERGWRYGVQPGESDSCVTSWAVLPLDSGRASGLDVSTEAFTDARRYLDEVTDESGRVGYNRKGTLSVRVEEVLDTFPPQETEALTAMAVVARLLAGSSRRPDDARIERGFGLLLAKPPSGRPSSMDLIYWYFGARAMEMMDDPRRESWDEALREVILKTQIAAGENRSSWNPDDAWGKEGGRVYTTALMALCLETLPR